MWDRVQFKNRAKAIMRTCYWKVFLVCLIASFLNLTFANGNLPKFGYSRDSGFYLNLTLGVYKKSLPLNRLILSISILTILLFIIALTVSVLLNTFVINVLRVGFCRYLVLTQKDGRSADISELFWGFTCGNYINLVKTMFLHDLYIFCWTLVFLIPGLVKSYQYYCVPYILAENPDMPSSEILAMSTAMTDGHKMDMFILALSFLGWEMLASMLFGIGTYFLTPYVELTNGEMYAFLRSRIDPSYGTDSYFESN